MLKKSISIFVISILISITCSFVVLAKPNTTITYTEEEYNLKQKSEPTCDNLVDFEAEIKSPAKIRNIVEEDLKKRNKGIETEIKFDTNKSNNFFVLSKNSSFDRDKAKAYAEKHATEPNTKSYPYYRKSDGAGVDCANFVSQVLYAGGMSEKGTNWGDYNSWFCNTTSASELKKCAITWRSANYFTKHWGNIDGVGANRAEKYTEMTVNDAVKNFNDLYITLWPGDVIQQVGSDGIAYHTQVVHDYGKKYGSTRNDVFIAQHSSDAKEVSLYDYLKYKKDNGYGTDKIFIYEIKSGS
ncbi:amidase domain-containing protein [Paramaledivibacter caminithermalis]|uniref:Putative amidase domain-containing protein n=1 Tax=Paramaledivibacter caminithermalis (strain DSM 15212 / CIP 107654 / DViRD3) TaxID=1121301 RepID=A0A1M6U7B7_PARC5|nr:amidase domain-containing protein [Paramaledivibacter caminithermalis]SHK65046.1 Putative amidase domain-containing protein [Paramaledivibacter caminithermalis DSM 15212]